MINYLWLQYLCDVDVVPKDENGIWSNEFIVHACTDKGMIQLKDTLCRRQGLGKDVQVINMKERLLVVGKSRKDQILDLFSVQVYLRIWSMVLASFFNEALTTVMRELDSK